LVFAVVASAIGYGVSPTVSDATGVGRVTMLNLTKSDRYESISVVGSKIVLYGPASLSLTASAATSTCSSAVVDPSMLALSDVRSGSCANPAVFDRSVVPAISLDKKLPFAGGGKTEIVRIAHVTSRSPGYALGPIVMTFAELAYEQTEPSWIYGGGDLWLYDWTNHFDLLRISATTGAVLQRLSVPKIQSPLLAFNDEGLWIAPRGESSGPLYRLTPGATEMSAAFKLGANGFAWWLVASGDSVWIDVQQRGVPKSPTVWELRGPDAVPVWHESASPEFRLVAEQGPLFSPSMVVGDGSDGLWTVLVSPSGLKQQVIRADPRTGKLTVVATLSPGYSPGASGGLAPALATWQAATFDGSLFLLDPPALVRPTAEQVGGFSALYRVTPSGA
jgi:hypothetical protein